MKNCAAFLHAKLRGKPCRPCNSDIKIRIKFPDHVRFYYPDANDSTRRTDLG